MAPNASPSSPSKYITKVMNSRNENFDVGNKSSQEI